MSGKGAEQTDSLEGVPAPEETPRIIGHQAVRNAVAEQMEAGRVPSAMLLHGPQGIGKATLAFEIARRLFSVGDADSPERIFEQTASGSHPNLFILRKKKRDSGAGFYSVIRVEEVRDIQQRIRQTRGRNGYRVCIIDSIDDCNANSANALLKILEEPPSETVFILVSHRPGALLPTIRSRCHVHAMRPLADDEVTEIVTMALHDTAPEEAARAVALAAGRPRRAIEALALAGMGKLEQLQGFLSAPQNVKSAMTMDLAEGVVRAGETELKIARGLFVDSLADEARQAATSGQSKRLASAAELWEKAHIMLDEADRYNLDQKQTLISLFDALKTHKKRFEALQP